MFLKPNSPQILLSFLRLIAALLVLSGMAVAQSAPVLNKFLKKVPASELVTGATAYGAMLEALPVVPVLKGTEVLGHAYITSDFVSTTGYSGKPIHVMVAMDNDGKLLSAELVKHSEPIVLIGIPNSKIKAMTESYQGLDIVAEAAAGGSGHDIDIISGATVTVMIIDDSIVRSSIKVARILELGGLNNDAANRGPTHELNMDEATINDWTTLSGDGTIRRMTLDIGQINEAFEATGDKRVLKHAEKGAPDDTYIDTVSYTHLTLPTNSRV
ncbi:MAG: FMN-binding protein [Rhodobacteraceae bacterium]|nr:FMN-binding protein [Paracoccaceae bacterium]